MFMADSAGRATGRFGGIEFVPATILVRGSGQKNYSLSNVQDNQARYNDFVPLVYGTQWHAPDVVFARNDGNLTRMEALIGMGPIQGVLKVIVNGQTNIVTGVGFKRRPFFAPQATRDLRIANHLYLQLSSRILDGQSVQVINDGTLWPTNMSFTAMTDPLRGSPAIHVNQEGYLPSYPKKAMIGYYLGNLGELLIHQPLLNCECAERRHGLSRHAHIANRRWLQLHTHALPECL